MKTVRRLNQLKIRIGSYVQVNSLNNLINILKKVTHFILFSPHQYISHRILLYCVYIEGVPGGMCETIPI